MAAVKKVGQKYDEVGLLVEYLFYVLGESQNAVDLHFWHCLSLS